MNSGSEANDLAMKMARLYSGNYDFLALRNGYHGKRGLNAHSTWRYNMPQVCLRAPSRLRTPHGSTPACCSLQPTRG